jgi:hypothetical protein
MGGKASRWRSRGKVGGTKISLLGWVVFVTKGDKKAVFLLYFYAWAYGPNLVWGGGTVLVCPTALLTQYTYTTLFEILSGPFLRIFPLGAFNFLKRDPSVR